MNRHDTLVLPRRPQDPFCGLEVVRAVTLHTSRTAKWGVLNSKGSGSISVTGDVISPG